MAYVVNDGGVLTAGNYFFTVDTMNEYAQEKHGFTIAALERLSGGRRFRDHAAEIDELLRGKRLVGHAIAADIRALKDEFNRCGRGFSPEKRFCTMNHFTTVMRIPIAGQPRPKNPNLTELCAYMGVTHDAISGMLTERFGVQSRAHDARYDVCATYLCIEKATRAGMVRGLIPGGR